MNTTYTHADNNNKYYQSKSTLVTKDGRLQSARLFATKVSIDYSFDAINRGLTQKDIYNFVMVLAQYIKSDSVLYVYDKGKRHKRPMTKEDMREILDLTKGSFYNFWARCIKANVIKLDKYISSNDVTRERIFVNPAFMQPNFSITPLAYWLFKSDLDNKLDDTTIAMYVDEFNRQYGIYDHKEADTFFNEVDKEEAPAENKPAGDEKSYCLEFPIREGIKDIPAAKQELLQVIYSFGLIPSTVIEMNRGYTCIWKLSGRKITPKKYNLIKDLLLSLFITAKVTDPNINKDTIINTEYNYTKYSINDFENELNNFAQEIMSACNNYSSLSY